MARSRNIKPGFFLNETLGDMDPLVRLLFIGLWTLADKEGRLEDRPRRIHVSCLPYDHVDIEACLDQLQTAGFIHRFIHREGAYIQIINWRRHQSPHHKEIESVIPEPPKKKKLEQTDNHACDKHKLSTDQASAKESGSCPTDSLNLIPDSLNLDSLKHTHTTPKPDTSMDPVDNSEKRAPTDGKKPEGEMAVRLRAMNVDVTSIHPILLSWVEDGYTVDQVVEVAEIAKQKKPGERIPAKYLDAILKGHAKQKPGKKQKPPNGGDDWVGLGEQVGVKAKRGESMQSFVQRVQVAMGERSERT